MHAESQQDQAHALDQEQDAEDERKRKGRQ
jgi:hypothetical protein